MLYSLKLTSPLPKKNKFTEFNVPIFYHFLFMFQLLSNVINCSQMQYHYII